MRYQVFVSGPTKSRAGTESDALDDFLRTARRFTGRSSSESGPRERITSGGEDEAHSGHTYRSPRRSSAAHSGHAHDSAGGDGALYAGSPGGAAGGDGVPYKPREGRAASVPRRFPPVIQFLTDVDPRLRQQLKALCAKSHRQGRDLQDVCRDLYLHAQSEGYDLTLGVQQVFSTKMPSFQSETVESALLLADVRPLSKAAESLHGSRG